MIVAYHVMSWWSDTMGVLGVEGHWFIDKFTATGSYQYSIVLPVVHCIVFKTLEVAPRTSLFVQYIVLYVPRTKRNEK